MGIQADDPVPATDDFLNKAQRVCYPDAPMDHVKAFSVEKVPAKILMKMQQEGAAGATPPSVKIVNGTKYFSGKSSIYFNSALSHTSAKKLFFTMGHEFVHVSQYTTLSGVIYTQEFHKNIIELMEFHAYSYEYNVLGSSNSGNFTPQSGRILMSQFPDYFHRLSYMNYPWTSNHSFIYPFKQ